MAGPVPRRDRRVVRSCRSNGNVSLTSFTVWAPLCICELSFCRSVICKNDRRTWTRNTNLIKEKQRKNKRCRWKVESKSPRGNLTGRTQLNDARWTRPFPKFWQLVKDFGEALGTPHSDVRLKKTPAVALRQHNWYDVFSSVYCGLPACGRLMTSCRILDLGLTAHLVRVLHLFAVFLSSLWMHSAGLMSAMTVFSQNT